MTSLEIWDHYNYGFFKIDRERHGLFTILDPDTALSSLDRNNTVFRLDRLLMLEFQGETA